NGSCTAKLSDGAGCGGNNYCVNAHCVNSVCCGTASCGTCQSCNGTMPGTCTPLAAGTSAPSGQCAASPPCGNTGTCNGAGRCPVNPPCGNNGLCASGACQQVAGGTMCSGFFCATGTTFQPGGMCTGTGSCTMPSVQDCSPYVCATGGCRGSCTDDSMCVGT